MENIRSNNSLLAVLISVLLGVSLVNQSRLVDVSIEMSLQQFCRGDAILQGTVSLDSPEVNWQQLGGHLTVQAA